MPRCKKCKIKMKEGIALEEILTGTPDFIGDKSAITQSPSGKSRLIKCVKCPKCGYSKK